MKIRFYNARILTLSSGFDIIEKGEIWVENEKIICVSDCCENTNMKLGKNSKREISQREISQREISRREISHREINWDREIDCEGNLLMPGFKDAHTHSPMTCMRSLADDLPLEEWLNEQIFPIEAKMTADNIYHLTKLAILEYVSGGITSIFDMYINPEAVGKACVDAGMRCVQVGSVNNFTLNSEYIEKMYLKWNNDNSLISYVLGFHAEYTTSELILKQIAQIAKKYQAPVYTHLSETKSEVESCIKRTGMTPTAYLDSLGIFDFGGGGYHCNHMSDGDIEIFKKRKLYVVTNPASNLKLASGIAPISKFLCENIPVAIGTDGPASNNCLDMFREMFLVTGLAKYREHDASAVDAREVLKMATINGANAMGLVNCDVLAPGKYADIIMVDLNQPNMQPLNNIVKNIVYSGNKHNIKMTMINGKILYENGEFYIDQEPRKIYKKANDIIHKLKEKEKP